MSHNLGICSGIEGAAPFVLELILQLKGIDDVAIVSHGQLAVLTFNQERLCVAEFAAATGRVSCMADGHVTHQRIEISLSEDLSNKTHFGMDYNVLSVRSCNSSTLLSSVLKGKKPKEC